MKIFMVISVIDGEQGAAFFNGYSDARQHAQNVECGMGGRSYLYRLNKETEEYEFFES